MGFVVWKSSFLLSIFFNWYLVCNFSRCCYFDKTLAFLGYFSPILEVWVFLAVTSTVVGFDSSFFYDSDGCCCYFSFKIILLPCGILFKYAFKEALFCLATGRVSFPYFFIFEDPDIIFSLIECSLLLIESLFSLLIRSGDLFEMPFDFCCLSKESCHGVLHCCPPNLRSILDWFEFFLLWLNSWMFPLFALSYKFFSLFLTEDL